MDPRIQTSVALPLELTAVQRETNLVKPSHEEAGNVFHKKIITKSLKNEGSVLWQHLVRNV